MAVKKINFDKSLAYYLKDKEHYLPCECHTNTYINYYDYNYEEVEKRIDTFRYVTGLMLINDEEKKIMLIHSWIEKNNEIIDVTAMANSFGGFPSIPDSVVEDAKAKFLEKVRYMPISSMSDIQFTKDCKKLGEGIGLDREAHTKRVEAYLQSIVSEASKSVIVKRQQDSFGYKFVDGDYSFFII